MSKTVKVKNTILFLKEYCSYIFLLAVLFATQNFFDNYFPYDTINFLYCLAALTFFIPICFRKIFFIAFLFVIGIFNIFLLVSKMQFNADFSEEFAASLFLTNVSEACEFLKMVWSWKLFVIGIIFCIPFVFLKFIKCKISFSCLEFFYVFIPLCFAVMFTGREFLYANAVPRNLYLAGKDLFFYKNAVRRITDVELNNVIDLDVHGDKKTYVIVLSDSVGRRYLSLYGYLYQTTPFLDSIKDDLLIFDNVVSRYNVTYKVLEKILTFSETDQDKHLVLDDAGLFDFFKKSGFKIYWLSTHPRYGVTNKFSYLTEKADVKKFRNVTQTSSSDEVILSDLKKALQDDVSKKIIFLHLQGSHGIYSSRYPEGFAEEFSTILSLRKITNVSPLFVNYVQSIIYGDELLSKILSWIQEDKQASSFMLYLSDHAEDVDLYGNAYFCHGNIYKKQVLEIPFVLWLSDVYKKHNVEFVKELAANRHKPYEINMLNHALLTLSRLEHQKIDKTKSIFNKEYQLRSRRYDELSE